MAALMVWLLSFPTSTDGTFDLIETERFYALSLGGNKGLKLKEKLDLFFFQKKYQSKKWNTVFENKDFSPRLGHK